MCNNAIWEQIGNKSAEIVLLTRFFSLSHGQKQLQDLRIFPQHGKRSVFVRRRLRNFFSAEISLIHQSGQSLPVKIPDPGILLGHHFRRCVPRVPLNGLDISAAQLQLVRRTERPKRMEYHRFIAVFADKLLEPFINDPCLQRPAIILSQNKAIIVI